MPSCNSAAISTCKEWSDTEKSRLGCAQKGAGSDSADLRANAVVAFLGNPVLLEGYLSLEDLSAPEGPRDQRDRGLSPLRSRGLTDFLVEVLGRWKVPVPQGTTQTEVLLERFPGRDPGERCAAACLPFLHK